MAFCLKNLVSLNHPKLAYCAIYRTDKITICEWAGIIF